MTFGCNSADGPPQNLHNSLKLSLDCLHVLHDTSTLHALHVLHVSTSPLSPRSTGYLVVGNSQSQAKWGGEIWHKQMHFRVW